MKHLKKFNTDTDRIAYESGSNYIEPYVSLVGQNNSVHYNRVPPNYLRFIALEDDSTLQLKKYDEDSGEEVTPTVDIEYSINGVDWSAYEYSVITLNKGNIIYLRGNNPNGFSKYDNNDDYTWHYFVTPSGSFECHGNIMSLLYSSNFETSPSALVISNNNCFYNLFYDTDNDEGCNIITPPELPATTLVQYCYSNMFRCTSLTRAPKLPATTLADWCYNNMFYGCTSLITAPELPAITLADHCYNSMFYGCTSLTTAPELPADTLATNCYCYMFEGCTSLTTAPELPATTLANWCYCGMFRNCTLLTTAPVLPADTLASYCYNGMFSGCTSLTTAPELPATTLATNCYEYMFNNCTSLITAPDLLAITLVNNCYCGMFRDCTLLTTAPELPATTLAYSCYNYMFYGCSRLNYIKAMFTTTPSITYTKDWVKNVASTGTFIKNSNAAWTITGANGIPTGWTATINYLRFTALENGSALQLKKWDNDSEEELTPTVNIECSYDGINFSPYNYILLEFYKGKTIYLRGNNPNGFSTYNGEEDDWTWHHFVTPQGSFECHGNIMSLLYGADFEKSSNALVIPNDSCFRCLFYDGNTEGGCNITTAPELPATTLTDSCYSGMFKNCTSLQKAPELPATSLAEYCYNSMFSGCISLVNAPQLSATTLAGGCYAFMFYNCTSLTVAPELPVTTLTDSCYNQMFRGCTNLTTAPELPATTLTYYCYTYMFSDCTNLTLAPKLPAITLAEYCYQGLFNGCTNLTVAPELPATTLVNNCYKSMFNGCTNLNYIKAMFTTTPGSNYTSNWVSGVASSGTFVKNSAATWNVTGEQGIPSGWTIQTYNPYVEEYFTTVARENGTISFNIWKSMGTDMITSISYSTDNGTTWTTTANQDNKSEHLTITVNVNEGDVILWKGIASQLGYWDNDDLSDSVGSFFSSDCEFDAKGNVMSLLYGDNFKNQTTIEEGYAFSCLFRDFDGQLGCGIVNAKDLILPVTTLAGCYYYMFSGCTSLITAPELPATTLTDSCYSGMFNKCTSLTTAPELPATILASGCYNNMFQNCTSLTSAPELPATTLTIYCYSQMFYGCTSLATAPELPATTLANECYAGMFLHCTSLTSAPELPATTLASSCYKTMFKGCSNLNYIKAMFTTTPSGTSPKYYTANWVDGVASSGTFVKNAAATWTTTGINGIPNGWTVETATE